jgi:hypothetical protein
MHFSTLARFKVRFTTYNSNLINGLKEYTFIKIVFHNYAPVTVEFKTYPIVRAITNTIFDRISKRITNKYIFLSFDLTSVYSHLISSRN